MWNYKFQTLTDGMANPVKECGYAILYAALPDKAELQIPNS
jgi:hypothetical protein